MKQTMYFDAAQRAVAAAAIESRLTAISCRLGLNLTMFVWNHGEGMNHKSPHLLDITVGEHVVRMYFTDHELACYWGEPVAMGTDARLEALCSSLQQLLQSPDEPCRSTSISQRAEKLKPTVGQYERRRASRGKKHCG
ncbi:MAG TPA: hypothetical protein VGU61_07115 [Noviherbaspirillum sp.]|jgi:hypothetical protein|uniref:hypothetical protein n=1 Tax=Noviherbaspirillum sp. TaxID=1926288 RepID=UPI002DDDB1DA|nr:hypothetical protein [Noviherbaspirillum sp.]HEV2610021.1 hypothetical protein [Noviherbaspirillum sp.]